MTRPPDRPRPELSSVDRSTARVLPEASIDGALRRWKSRVNEEGELLPDRAEPADLLDRSMSDDGERRPSEPLCDRSRPTGSGATAATLMAETFRRIVCERKASRKLPKLPNDLDRRFSRLAPWRFNN